MLAERRSPEAVLTDSREAIARLNAITKELERHAAILRHEIADLAEMIEEETT